MWNFEIITIRKADSREVNEGWYHYEIANRITSVSGTRRGSHEEVSAFVQAVIRRLNSRHLSTSGYHGR